MNGYARCIWFTAEGENWINGEYDPYIDYNKNEFRSMKEGKFHNGKFDGFGRTMKQAKIEVGYHFEGDPFGKFQLYASGSLAQQGLYDEVHTGVANSLKKEKRIYSFEKNEIPPLH